MAAGPRLERLLGRPAGAPFVVLGTNDVLTRPLACGDAQGRGPGACVVAPGKAREDLRVRCFTLDEIKSGRAFAVLDGDRLVGLVPDRSLEVAVTTGDGTVRLPARENACRHASRAWAPGVTCPCAWTSIAP